jgi:alpha-tubulin suppressor-like RCC1 family protein
MKLPVFSMLFAAAMLTSCGGGISFCPAGVPCGGEGPSFAEAAPVPVATPLRFEQIGLGTSHSCMLTAAGEAWCWGSNEYGQLGAATAQRCNDGMTDCSSTPLQVSGNLAFVSLAASGSSSCGLTAGGNAWCWGTGQLGDGLPIRKSLAPVAVAGGHAFGLLAVSLNLATACGLEADRSLWCWGGGLVGSSGPPASASPARWDNARSVAWTQFSLGEQHACGLDAAGQAWCIGSNWFRALGNGDSADSAVPVPVSGGRVYREITVGSMHTCALAVDGQAWCWGSGAAVGDGGLADTSRNIPVAVAGNVRFSQIASGWDRSCGLTEDGSAWCWGDGYGGTLGDGTGERRPAPVAVVGGIKFRTIRAGGATCGIALDGTAYCWGDNRLGAIGAPIVAR